MPKQRITKEMVLQAAMKLLREKGEEQVLVKNIAAELACSVQPIYSYCSNMDALRQELAELAGDLMRAYVKARIDPGNPFESTGKAHMAFAKEEPHLFKSYFLRRRDHINSLEALYAAEAGPDMAGYLAKTLGLSESRAKKLHMDMIIYNTGLSFMLVSMGECITEQELNDRLGETYRTLLAAAKEEG